MPCQLARLPKRSVALRARVVSALLVHRAHMRPQTARRLKRSVALRARVVSALLVHRAHMRPQMAGVPGLVVALRARCMRDLGSFPMAPQESDAEGGAWDGDRTAGRSRIMRALAAELFECIHRRHSLSILSFSPGLTKLRS